MEYKDRYIEIYDNSPLPFFTFIFTSHSLMEFL